MTIAGPRGIAVLPSGGTWLRLGTLLAAAGVLTVSWVPTATPIAFWTELLAMVGVGSWLVLQPGSVAGLVLVAGVFAVQILTRQPVLDGSLIVLVVLLPVLHQLAALAAVVPPRSTLRLSALLPTGLRCAGAILFAIAALLLGHWAGLFG